MTPPIEPGSDVDDAINAVVAYEMDDGEDSLPTVAQLSLVGFENSAHMLALGTRLVARRQGIRDPLALTASLYGMWYGQPSDV